MLKTGGRYNPIFLIFPAVAVMHLAAELISWPIGTYLSKPLLMPALALQFWVAVRPMQRFHWWIFSGLTFSWLGDVLLMFVPFGGQNFFLLGLGSFLMAHLAYISAFIACSPDLGYLKSRPLQVLPFVIYLFLINSWWWDNLSTLRIPVLLYSLVITAMALSALNLRHVAAKRAWIPLFSGALLFVLSDSLLAAHRFMTPIPMAGFLIMTTYILAQYFLVFGARLMNIHSAKFFDFRYYQ